MARVSALLSLVLPLLACDPPQERDDSKPPSVPLATPQPTAQSSAVEPATPRITTLPAATVSITLVAIRRGPAKVEIEISLDRKLPMTGRSHPTLRAGTLVLSRSRHPDGALDRLVFLATPAELDALADDAPLTFSDGTFTSEAMTTTPVLDKSLVREVP